jgi:hypothetical protein
MLPRIYKNYMKKRRFPALVDLKISKNAVVLLKNVVVLLKNA